MLFKLTINHLQNYLTKAKFNPQYQKETDQVYLLQQRMGIEIASFLRLMEGGNLLQIITFVPIKIRKETVNDLARLLHKINRDIDFPGFCMDESSELVFYRIVMPCINQQCDGDILEKHLRAIPIITSSFYKLIAPVIKGEKTYEEMLVNPAASSNDSEQ